MPSSRRNVRMSGDYIPLPTDVTHPDYPDSCPRNLRAMRAGKQAYEKYEHFMQFVNPDIGGKTLGLSAANHFSDYGHRFSDGVFPPLLDEIISSVKSYDSDGLLSEKSRVKLSEFMVAQCAKDHNVLWEDAFRYFSKERVLHRLKKSGGNNGVLHTDLLQ